MSQIDLNGSSLRALAGADESKRPAIVPTNRPATESRSWIGRAVESTIYGILIVPFAAVVCAVVAFAILPLHSDSRYDDGYE